MLLGWRLTEQKPNEGANISFFCLRICLRSSSWRSPHRLQRADKMWLPCQPHCPDQEVSGQQDRFEAERQDLNHWLIQPWGWLSIHNKHIHGFTLLWQQKGCYNSAKKVLFFFFLQIKTFPSSPQNEETESLNGPCTHVWGKVLVPFVGTMWIILQVWSWS